MKVNNKQYRTVWIEGNDVCMIEQNLLPFEFHIYHAKTYKDTCGAIKTMIVRGAGALGTTAGYAMAQASMEAPENKYSEFISQAKSEIESARPTAQNLFYAVERVYNAACISKEKAVAEAKKVADEDALASRKIGEYGNTLIKDGFNILTHCNAGWLAFVDYGTALSPIYTAHHTGKKIFVYVDETRPRSQGARLTAWELKNENVPHAIIPDNAGAFLMSQGKVNMIITGADRIARNGDTANKIGTLEKAIVAKHFRIPFYVAAPTSTIDLNCPMGKDIPIEHRSEEEVLYQTGLDKNGNLVEILVCSPGSNAINPAFDVTPAEFITGIITEKGIISASEKDITSLITDVTQNNK
ncbi:MAG: S-methyl-5-thioribose-1-phosphate isomerase [Bacteroidales bacterium]